jgi:peptidoglycan/LPS O-acetylase OafA/YrhL
MRIYRLLPVLLVVALFVLIVAAFGGKGGGY